MTTPPIPAHLEVMRGWLGTKEVPGPKANPTIAGKPWSWFSVVGYPGIKDDVVANCAAAVGAALVFGELIKIGIDPKNLTVGGPTALDLIAEQGAPLALPPLDDRLMARSYCKFGVDAKKDPQPGDIMVIPRGTSWQGHVMLLNKDLGGGAWECIGANQSDTTSYARHRLGEALAIRRYVPATVKDLRMAGSQAIQRGDNMQATGAALGVGVPAIAAANAALSPAAPVADAVANTPSLQEMADGTTLVHTLTSTGTAIGNLFVQNPWLVGCIGAGTFVWWLGRTGKLRRVAQHAAGVPLSVATFVHGMLPDAAPEQDATA